LLKVANAMKSWGEQDLAAAEKPEEKSQLAMDL
jgi:hypothetical protein